MRTGGCEGEVCSFIAKRENKVTKLRIFHALINRFFWNNAQFTSAKMYFGCLMLSFSSMDWISSLFYNIHDKSCPLFLVRRTDVLWKMQRSLERSVVGNFHNAQLHIYEHKLIFYQYKFTSRFSFVILSSDLSVFSHGKLIAFAEPCPLLGKQTSVSESFKAE